MVARGEGLGQQFINDQCNYQRFHRPSFVILSESEESPHGSQHASFHLSKTMLNRPSHNSYILHQPPIQNCKTVSIIPHLCYNSLNCTNISSQRGRTYANSSRN